MPYNQDGPCGKCGKARPDHPFQQCPEMKCHRAECGEYGHNKWDCPNITCYRCEGKGHYSYECSTRRYNASRRPLQMVISNSSSRRDGYSGSGNSSSRQTVLTLEETQDQQPPTQAEPPASLKTRDHAHDPCPPTQAELPVSLKTLGHAQDPCLPTAEEWITQGLAPRAALGSL